MAKRTASVSFHSSHNSRFIDEKAATKLSSSESGNWISLQRFECVISKPSCW